VSPTRRAWRRVASSSAVGFRRWARQFALRVTTFEHRGNYPRRLRPSPAGAARCPRSRAASAAADLPRPSAEEASPDIGTSDALCHTVGARDRALQSSLRRLPGRNDPHQRAHRIRPVVTPACLRPAQLGARTPSIGSIFGLASKAGSRSLTVRLRALAPHPFTHCESVLLVKDEPPHQATPSR